MRRLDNTITGPAWKSFIQKYKVGNQVNGRVRFVEPRGVSVALIDREEDDLGVYGLMRAVDLPSDFASMYVSRQKVHTRIIDIREPGKRGRIDLEPSRIQNRKWLDFPQMYPEGSVVGGIVVKIIGVDCVVRVLLHDLQQVGVIRQTGMFPCCRRDIASHFQEGQQLKLYVKGYRSNVHQWEIQLGMQRISYDDFAEEFPQGSTLDGTVHSRDENFLHILLDAGIMGRVDLGTNAPEVGRKVRVRVENVSSSRKEITLALQDSVPKFGRVYRAEDKGFFSSKLHRPVVTIASWPNVVGRGLQIGRINTVVLATHGRGKWECIPCDIKEVCLTNRCSSRVVVREKGYPLQKLQHYSHYMGELPQKYQNEIRRLLSQ